MARGPYRDPKQLSEDRLTIFSEYRSHGRHLENHLLSFTQLFLLMTGALWGYALTPGNGAKQSWFGQLVFVFHLFYCVVGGLYVVRLSLNFRMNFDMADQVLEDVGLDRYKIEIPPHGPGGRILRQFQLLLTAKAFFLLIYVGTFGVDTYFLLLVGLNWKILAMPKNHPLIAAWVLSMLFLGGAAGVFKTVRRLKRV